MTAPPDDNTADLHAVIEALRAERDAAMAREAKLGSDYAERAAHQGATVEVLQAMAASPGEPEPVFEVIVRRARDLCDAHTASLARVVDGSIVLRAYCVPNEAEAKGHEANFPRPVAADTMFGRAILAREPVQLPDVAADQTYALREGTLRGAVRAQAAVPLMRDGEAIGAINMTRRQTGEFSQAQIELLQVFADQAVIAINGAEMYRALQTRTTDLQETLEYQTATSDVLKVISRSTFDLQPVLDTVVETAAKLCVADMAHIGRREGDVMHFAANYGFPPEYETYLKARGPVKLDPGSPTVAHRTLIEGRPVHIDDVTAVPGYPEVFIRLGKHRTSLGVPLLRGGDTIGFIQLSRQQVEPFTDRQIELVSTFADQAVIAIENTRLITEQREALEQQTATAEVLQVINASPGNLAPVFAAILERSLRLCGAAFGMLATYDGTRFRWETSHGSPDGRSGGGVIAPEPGSALERVANGQRVVHIPDLVDTDAYRDGIPSRVGLVERAGARAGLWVTLRKDDTVMGVILIYRREPRAFSDKQIALLESFATQAVIAMENARLITEQREALEQQTATAEVLQVINASPGNLTPVFDAMLEKAMRLCGAAFGELHTFSGDRYVPGITKGVPAVYADYRRQNTSAGEIRPGTIFRRIQGGARFVHIVDLMAEELYTDGDPGRRAMVDLGGARTFLGVALRKDDTLLGLLTIYRQEVCAFSDKEIDLLKNFAAQAVIAMESARLLHELRARTDELAQRQTELRVTFENMGDGVAMFDETQYLAAWNRKFQDILDLPDAFLEQRRTYEEHLHFLAARGDFGPGVNTVEQIEELVASTGQPYGYERTRPDGRVIEIRRNPVPGGGFVLIYSDITERKQSEAEIRAARDAAEAALRELKTAQANLIQAEKMASLGQLTAGIAHEIKNPLNFVNNFAALSVDLLGELKETAEPGFAALTEKQRAEVEEISVMLTSNLEKITEHGKRADGIVKAMLEHSRGSSGERRVVDLNALIDEALNLAYHGARAQDQSFNITLERDIGAGIAPIEVNPQDITRVFLNIFSNGFYAATRRARDGGDAGFVPTLKVTTRDAGEAVEIRVRDNGTGIPNDIRGKLFQPFFTTKPTGEGTGLGLSITYDIVTQQHGGNIAVESEVGDYSEFTIRLPRSP